MARDVELDKCMARWNAVFANDAREAAARDRADAELRQRSAKRRI
jgi:hypothetical protein